MARKTNSFEGGSNGTTVTTGNSGGASGNAANTVTTGASFTHRFTTAQAAHGTLSLEQAGGAGTQCHFTWDFGPVDRIYGRAYVRFATGFQARSLIQCRAAASQTWRIALLGTGAVVFNNAANTTLDTSPTLSLDTWYRIEYDVTQSTGNATVTIYAGDSTTPFDTLSASGASLGTADYDEVRHGQIANATGLNSMFWDDLDVNDIALPGPATTSYQTLTGAVTPAGVLVRQDNKTFTGTLTPAGTLTRSALKTLAGAVTPTSALVRQAGKVVAGSLTPAGVAARTTGKALGGALVPAGSATRTVGKVLGGTAATAGALARLVGKSLGGALSPSGALSTQVEEVAETVRATSTPTVTARRTSESAVAARRTGSPAVTAHRTSAPDVS